MPAKPKRSERMFGEESIRTALRMLQKTEGLGQHPLATTRLVEVKRQMTGRSHSPVELGWALRDVLLEGINSLKPTEGRLDYQNPDWHPYILLYDQYVKRRPVDHVADDLGIERRTYYRWQDRAIAALANLLHQWENESSQRIEEHHRRSPFLAPPIPPYLLIKRQQFLSDIKRHLSSSGSNHRCALYGLPGAGKTALALEIAHAPDILNRFGDGVLWAGLGQNPNVLTELRTWATAVGLSKGEIDNLAEQGDTADTPIERLAKAVRYEIGARRMLLVIDDAWSLEAALAFEVGGPNCAYVLTTRLRDVAQDFAEQGVMRVGALSEAEGLLLFNQLAPEVVTAEPDAAFSLVKAVGGLPLAIILIARYARQFMAGHGASVKDVLSELREASARFQLKQPQSPAGRHPSLPITTPLSLSASLSLSVNALNETGRRAFYALAVFPPKPNTFSKDAALAVSNGNATLLAVLINAGLLEERGAGRYTLHQTVADYARLQPVDAVALGRMMRYYTDLVETQSSDHRVLDVEMANILAALEMAYKQKHHTRFIDGANAFYPFLSTRGLYAVAEQHLVRARRLSHRLGDKTRMVTALLNLGRLHNNRGDYTWTLKHLPDGVKLARGLRNSKLVCDLTRTLGVAADLTGKEAEARSLYIESLKLARRAKDTKRVIPVLLNFGGFEFDFGHMDVAEQYWLEALRLCHEKNDYSNYSPIVLGLGNIASDRGDFAATEAYYRDGLAVARKQGRREDICYQLGNLGALLNDLGRHSEALRHLEEGLVIARETGNLDRTSALLRTLGDVLTVLGDYDQAHEACEESVRLARKTNHPKNTTAALAVWGTLLTRLGDYRQAEKHLREALKVARDAKNNWHTSDALNRLGELHLEEGKFDLAESEFAESLPIAEAISKQLYAEALYGMAKVRASQGQPDEAASLGHKAYTLAKTIGYFKHREIHHWLKGKASLQSAR